MDIVPVVDLMDGRVVQGRAGEREKYRPVDSALVEGSDPLDVAQALLRHTGATRLYVADLDAITGRGVQLRALSRLASETAAELWVDAGVATPQAAHDLLEAGAARVVVGTETLPGADALGALRASLSDQRLLLSLDLGDEGLLSPSPALRGLGPASALRALDADDLPQVLVLTLRRVGTSSGPDLATLDAFRAAFPGVSLVAGGGVRSPADLTALAGRGVDAVLVATAIHSRALDAAAIRALRTH